MLFEKNMRHHGTYAIFADDRHICTYSYKENAQKAAVDLTAHVLAVASLMIAAKVQAKLIKNI